MIFMEELGLRRAIFEGDSETVVKVLSGDYLLMWREVWLEFCHKPIRPNQAQSGHKSDLIQVEKGIPLSRLS